MMCEIELERRPNPDEEDVDVYLISYEVTITANEYEGGYLSSRGDAEIHDVTCDGRPFSLTEDEKDMLRDLHLSDVGSRHYAGSW